MKTPKQIAVASILVYSLIEFSQSSFAQQDYYKWVDSHGSTHYTTTPPPKAKGVKTHGKIKTYGWAAKSAPPETTTDTAPASQTNHQQHGTTPNNQSAAHPASVATPSTTTTESDNKTAVKILQSTPEPTQNNATPPQ